MILYFLSEVFSINFSHCRIIYYAIY